MLEQHDLDRTPCGPHSPFRTITESGGKIVMLGCGLRPNTTMHAIEEVAGVPYVLGEPRLYTIVDRHGRTWRRTYATHGFRAAGCIQRYDRVGQLPGMREYLRQGRILDADTQVLDAAGLRRVACARMAEDPMFFVDCPGA